MRSSDFVITRMITDRIGLHSVLLPLPIQGNGYEAGQSSLLHVIVLFFGLDPAQNTIVVYSELRN